MEKEILKYLKEKNDRTSVSEISKNTNLEISKINETIKILRDQKLIEATNGWSEQKYTNIKITTKGVKSLEKKQPKSKNMTTVNIENNHGNVSVGDKNKQSFKKNSEEILPSKFFWWAMAILGAVIAGGILYYLDLI